MNARIYTAAAFATLLPIALPARAASSQLLYLVPPDAVVLAGVNVDQARTTPFGQYVLTQVQTQQLQQIKALTGFDPTQDVHELLVASNGPNNHSGLALALGKFDPSKIAALAAAHGGSTTETYGGATIIEDEKKTHGIAFLGDGTIAVAGDLASVKAAIDRQAKPSILPANVMTAVNQWSLSQDAWVICTVPPSSLHPPAGAPSVPGVGPSQNNAFKDIQSAAGGVKFGNNVVVTAQAQAGNSQDAQNMADMLKLLASMAQLQAKDNPAVQSLSQSLQATVSGTTLNVSISLPEDQLQAIVKQGPHARPQGHGPVHKR